MAIMKDKMMRFLRRALLLCLCMVLLAGSALANEVVDISTDGYDCLYYRGQLPDGRVLFSGWKCARPGRCPGMRWMAGQW